MSTPQPSGQAVIRPEVTAPASDCSRARSRALSMLSGADDPVEAGVKRVAHQADS